MKGRISLQVHPIAGQEGAVLVVSLIFLLILTLLGLSGMGTTTLEEKMAGNLRDLNLAFQATESALRDAEGWVMSRTDKPTPDASATQGVYPPGTLMGMANQTTAWWDAHGIEYGESTGAALLDDVNTQPHYIIEHDAFVSDTFDVGITDPTGRNFYRITARGTGGTDTALTVLETTYVRRFN